MDEDKIYEHVTIEPRRHDRWSVLILGLDYIGKVTQVTANTLTSAMIAACEHANQVKIDERFKEMISK